jgi:hypothetical protein
MAFSIRLDDKLKNGLCPGVITIGDFSEGFEASLCYWSRHNYKQHWKKSIEKLLKDDANVMLITSMGIVAQIGNSAAVSMTKCNRSRNSL